MKIIVFGATGRTGELVCKRALRADYEVTVFGRSVAKLESIDPNLHQFQGDVFDADAVSKAVANHDAVIVCLGSVNLKDKTTLAAGTRNIVNGMRRHTVKRLVILSAAGVGESWVQISWFVRLLFKTLLHNVFADHHAQEEIVKGSALDWTIVRAAVLNDKPASGVYTVSNTGPVRKISRADLADFIVTQVSDEAYVQQAISVTS